MIRLADYQTEKALPAEMRTAERIALSYAFDCQKKKYCDRVKRACIWGNLENVDDSKLDFLAVESRVMFYNSWLTPDIKKKLILNHLSWYMKLGTKQAMEEMIATYYPDTGTKMEEWFEYGGEPYHFRIETTVPLDEDCYAELRQLIYTVKNARSRLDEIRTIREISGTFYMAAGITSRYKNPPLREGIVITRCIGMGYSKDHYENDEYSYCQY